MAIGDTIIPSIAASSTPSTAKLSVQESEYTAAIDRLNGLSAKPQADLYRKFLEENASSIPGVREAIQRLLSDYMPEDARKGFRVVLSALDTRAGCFLMTGYTTSFHLHPVNVRQQILKSWAQSYLPQLRKAAASFGGLFAATWTRQSPTLGPVVGYPRAPVHGKPGKGFDYSFVQFPPGTEPEVIETDVVIVGSGCGGGVCAKNLAEAGHRVIVLEKAYHYPAAHLPMTEADAAIHLFMNGGVIRSDEGSVAVIAGQAFGGGGTINWSASLQTQRYVREEWADGGLKLFTSSEYQKSLDRVCGRMGVSADHIEHGKNNQLLYEGARKLGYSVKPVPQNTGGKTHYCGYCTLGCGLAEKQGPVVSFLPDAEKAGAKFIEGFDAEQIIFENIKGKKVATGVRGLWKSRDSNGGVRDPNRTTREVIVKAKSVIVSCGTLQSPLLLLRSGLKNPQIGRNLHLHPVTLVGAAYPELIKPWEGPILTTVVDDFQNLDGHGHGCKIEALTMLPSWCLPFFPWTGGLDFKMFSARFPYMSGHLSLTRDRDTGRVFPDPKDGRCRISYTPSAFDKSHSMEGLLACARIAYVNGAKEIFVNIPGLRPFVRDSEPESHNDETGDFEGVNDAKFEAWLAGIKKHGLNAPEMTFGTAHQMGTCRMATSERNGVVDPKGKVWGTDGLYVADASVFPSASGVNPMVTNMAISDWISRGVARGLKGEPRL